MFTKVGRNQPCPCGSGKKFKKCSGQSNVREEHCGPEQSASNERFLVVAIDNDGEAVAYTPAGEAQAEAQRRGIAKYLAIAAFATFRNAAGLFRSPTCCLFITTDQKAREVAERTFREMLAELKGALTAIQQGDYVRDKWGLPLIASARLVSDLEAAGDEWRESAHLVMKAMADQLVGSVVTQ